MNIYSLDYDANLMIGNGISQARCLFDAEIRKSFSNKFPEIDEVLQFEMHYNAKKSNCLSQGGIASSGFLIDSKFKDILASFQIMKHRFYPAHVIKKEKIYDYFWLNLVDDLTNEIDFENSLFHELHLASRGDRIRIESLQHYQNMRDERGWRWSAEADLIAIKKGSFLENYDMFRFFPFDFNICISERLKNSLEENRITGITIEKLEKVIFQ